MDAAAHEEAVQTFQTFQTFQTDRIDHNNSDHTEHKTKRETHALSSLDRDVDTNSSLNLNLSDYIIRIPEPLRDARIEGIVMPAEGSGHIACLTLTSGDSDAMTAISAIVKPDVTFVDSTNGRTYAYLTPASGVGEMAAATLSGPVRVCMVPIGSIGPDAVATPTFGIAALQKTSDPEFGIRVVLDKHFMQPSEFTRGDVVRFGAFKSGHAGLDEFVNRASGHSIHAIGSSNSISIQGLRRFDRQTGDWLPSESVATGLDAYMAIEDAKAKAIEDAKAKASGRKTTAAKNIIKALASSKGHVANLSLQQTILVSSAAKCLDV